MKKMSKEAQMQANGGTEWAHCHVCGLDFSATTKEKVREKVLVHIKLKGHTGYAIWDYGKFVDCKNY